MIPVDDPSDERIAAFVGLRDRDLQRQDGLFVAESDLLIARALRAGYEMRAALVDATRSEPLIVPAGVPVYGASRAVLERITGLGVHRGSIGSFVRRPVPAAAQVMAGRQRIIVLEGVVNPTNMGVIVRSAVALGWEAVLLDPTCTDPLFRRSARVAMGTVYGFPHATLPRFPAGLQQVADAGFTLVALTPDADAEAIDEVAVDGPIALVFGSEGPGLTTEALATCHRLVRIPLADGVDSLNVASAAAIACWALRPNTR